LILGALANITLELKTKALTLKTRGRRNEWKEANEEEIKE
jgi:hypothetical protein